VNGWRLCSGTLRSTASLIGVATKALRLHTWQLLMAGQLPIITYFALRWLSPAPRKATPVLLLQIVAAVAALAPVYLLRL
jgi:hypothetical protein